MNFHIGHGYDFHRLAPGRQLYLGGILIPNNKGLSGHSDADVLIHAICDALLGALAAGDIGKLFPDNDEAFKDIDSKVLLEKVNMLLIDGGWQIANLDTTLIMEAPKVAPYIKQMRTALSAILNTDISNVSVKATTTEGMGPEGRGEGISAHAVVLIQKI
jgi:2-C-methyl-D-erythritol 2,4-cyclodiphosphate synthase